MSGKLNILRWLRYKYLLFIRIKDHPANIATGVALGVSFDVLPTFGLGVIFAYFFATLLKVNRLSTLISAVVFKLAIPFFIYINVQMGQIFISEPRHVENKLLSHPWDLSNWSHLGTSFLLGSVINAVLVFILAFAVSYRFVAWKRSHKFRGKFSL